MSDTDLRIHRDPHGAGVWIERNGCSLLFSPEAFIEFHRMASRFLESGADQSNYVLAERVRNAPQDYSRFASLHRKPPATKPKSNLEDLI